MATKTRLSRREVIAAVGASSTVALAGCLEYVPFVGDDPMEFVAAPAIVPESALEDTGYEERAVEESTIERTYEVAGQTQDVHVTNTQAEYDRAVDLGELGLPIQEEVQAAIVTALSTPQVNVLDRTFNPVGDMDADELAELVQDRYEGLNDIERVGETTAPVAGRSTTVAEFEAEAEHVEAGASVELTLHIAEAVEAGDDFVIAIGAYPRPLHEQEADTMFALMDMIDHEG